MRTGKRCHKRGEGSLEYWMKRLPGIHWWQALERAPACAPYALAHGCPPPSVLTSTFIRAVIPLLVPRFPRESLADAQTLATDSIPVVALPARPQSLVLSLASGRCPSQRVMEIRQPRWVINGMRGIGLSGRRARWRWLQDALVKLECVYVQCPPVRLR